MIKKTSVLVICGLLKIAIATAQQDPLYAQYINNPFVINPAYAGITNNLNTSVSYRQQWSGLEGSPKTINANSHISLLNNKMGAGLILISDKIGGTTTNDVFATYSYRVAITNNSTLAFGLQVGAATYKFNSSSVILYDPNDPAFQGSYSETKPQFGAGLILTSAKYFVGVSVPRMLHTSFSANALQTTLYNQHFYALGSYLFFISERIRLKPSALVKVVSGAPASVDLNASLIFYENYQAGLLTRNFNTYGLFMQALFKNTFRLGYVFEVPTGSSVGSNFTTHEITVGLRVNALSFHDNNSIMSF